MGAVAVEEGEVVCVGMVPKASSRASGGGVWEEDGKRGGAAEGGGRLRGQRGSRGSALDTLC